MRLADDTTPLNKLQPWHLRLLGSHAVLLSFSAALSRLFRFFQWQHSRDRIVPKGAREFDLAPPIAFAGEIRFCPLVNEPNNSIGAVQPP
jgi:hypothetical protein